MDEALLVTNMPNHWEALEKVGVTGAIDLAWYHNRDESLAALATEVRIEPRLLKDIAERLHVDAQVSDLCSLYWDGVTRPAATDSADQTRANTASEAEQGTLFYQFKEGIEQEARERSVVEVKRIPGVRDATIVAPGELRVIATLEMREAVDTRLREMAELQPK